MRRAIEKHLRDVIAIAIVAVVAVIVGGYVLSNQRFAAPAWVPFVGNDFVVYEADFTSAQAFTAGQGQAVMIAGVEVGEIGEVRLHDGRARITMRIRRRYTPIYRNATALARPKTGLNDMTIQLDPGTRAAGRIEPGGVLPVSQTEANVNPDEVLAGLDADTRSYLRLLIGGAGQALDGNSQELSATLKRFNPTARYLARIGNALARREANTKRAIRNFRLLAEALGESDAQLADFVTSSNDVLRVFADEQTSLRESLRELPTALSKTNDALVKTKRTTDLLGPTLGALRPTARGLSPALLSVQDLARSTTPVIEGQLRPFTKQAAPTVSALRPAAADLAEAVPKLDTSLQVVNQLVNQLAYNPPGKQEGYLFWLAWANHLQASMFGAQDAHGPTRRGIVFGSCDALLVFERVSEANRLLGTLADLLNAPKSADVCPASGTIARVSKAKAARAISRLEQSGALGPTPPDGAGATTGSEGATTGNDGPASTQGVARGAEPTAGAQGPATGAGEGR
ncbi:MAG: MlaD family protein [Solirubrobacteraceae bacterium]|nr:MlaD family protein [Solirubrobacteraceae bacterium]